MNIDNELIHVQNTQGIYLHVSTQLLSDANIYVHVPHTVCVSDYHAAVTAELCCYVLMGERVYNLVTNGLNVQCTCTCTLLYLSNEGTSSSYKADETSIITIRLPMLHT